MRHFDLSPLYRSTVGFDHLFSMLDSMGRTDNGSASYPPYDIERTGENDYRIVMAVAGFREEDLSIELKQHTLTVRGEKKSEEPQSQAEVLYRGIAQRSFERRFQLADYVQVSGARLENGLLSIELVREIPDAMKPRTIEIGAPRKGGKVIDQKAA